jgi:hypothetical protein
VRARRFTALAAAGVCLCWPADGRAEDAQGFGFFQDNKLSFESTKEAEQAVVAPPPSARPAEDEEGREAPPPASAAAAPSEEAPRHAPPPPPERPSAGRSAPADRGDRSVEVLRVRELTADERVAMKALLRCPDPLAAEVRLSERLRTVLAEVTRLGTNRLPETVSWVFGRTGRCFDRPGGLATRELDVIDEAARRAAPPKGTK